MPHPRPPAHCAPSLSTFVPPPYPSLDLAAERNPQWNVTEEFFGTPWVWCMLHNFGGRSGMYGRWVSGVHERMRTLLRACVPVWWVIRALTCVGAPSLCVLSVSGPSRGLCTGCLPLPRALPRRCKQR